MNRHLCAVSLVGMLVLGPSSAIAGIHTWDVSEVFSNADGTIQFIELKETAGGNNEGGVGNGSISSDTLDQDHSWSNGTVSNTANKFYLIASQGFADLPGAPTPDVILPANKVPFFATSGDTVSFSTWDSCTFGPVPVDGVNSFDCLTSATGANSPTNYAGGTGSVDGSAPASITLNHVDTFQAGTLQNWSGNSDPVNQPNGGPGGAGDRYLQLSAASFNLGSFNKVQWSGNYQAAGVGQVGFDLNNFGPSDVNLRIMLFTPGCDFGATACTAWTSTNALALPSGSGWVAATFSLDEADLTRVLGSDSHAASLQNVERLLIRHDADAPSPPGSPSFVTATLGIDNVTAMPEPSALIGLGVGAAALAGLRRRRQA